MKVFNFLLLGLALFTANILGDDSKSKNADSNEDSGEGLSVGQGPGKVANTDTSKYAGVYNFSYFYSDGKENKTLLLPCKNVTGFTLDFPAGEGVDIGKDFSSLKDGVDPIYKTAQSSWLVKELALGKGFDTLKVSIFVDDSEEQLVCWTTNFVNKQLIINLNPNNFTNCPTRFVPSTKTCRKDVAFLLGTCVSGPCTGDGSKPREENTSKASKAGAAKSKASIASFSLLLVSAAFFITL